MGSGFSFVEMWHQAGIVAKMVVVVLAIMSVASLTVIAERLVTFLRAQKESIQYVMQLRGYIAGRRLGEAIQVAQMHKHSPLARVVGAGISEYVQGLDALRKEGPDDVGDFDLVDAVNRALERVKEREIADLRRGLGVLATVGSTAPFVGLFGTTFGIITAFQGMASSGSGGLGAIAGGISEALITTAFGILVAVPAVWMFNFFTNKVEGLVVDINDVSSELVDYMLKEGRTTTMAARMVGAG
jgi:biopolymer transport protein ExbB